MSATRRNGLIIISVSALLYSTPGLFTRGVEASGWDVIFWRALFGVFFTALFYAWRGTLRAELEGMDRWAWLASIIWATGALAYLHAYKLTTIANVSLIYGSAPILTALVAWFALSERPRKIVFGASLLAFVGVLTIGRGSLGSTHILGDLLALWMTFTVALSFPLYRRHPQIPAGGTTILASLLAVPPALYWGTPMSVAGHEIAILALFGLVFAVASTLLTMGSKMLPSGEAALISNLEVPVQPLLAYAVFAEVPAIATFIGGALILVAIGLAAWPESWNANRTT
jgi:drug/metabolite transporter (DMT)-like permease